VIHGEHHPGQVVCLRDRPLLVGPVGIDASRGEAAVAGRPEQQEAIPASVEGQVLQRPLHTGADLGVVVRVREHPLRGPLEHGETADAIGDGGRDLKAGGTGADQRDVPVRQVDVVIPSGGVKSRAGKGFRTG